MMARNVFTGAVLLGLLSTGSTARADFVRVMRERMDFSNGYLNADGSLYSGSGAALINQQVSNAWSTFSQDFAVLRFYAVFNDPTDRMFFFGSTFVQPLSLNVFNPAGRQFFEPNTSSILPGNLLNSLSNPTLAFDSWLTIGAADAQADPGNDLTATPTMPNSMLDGMSIPADRDGIFLQPFLSTNPDVFNPLTTPDAQGRVLFAQITIQRRTRYSFRGSLAYFPAGDRNFEIERTFSFAAVPAPGAISLLAMAGLIGRSRRRRINQAMPLTRC